MPIFRGDQVVGTLGIGVRGERTFTEAETAELLAAGGDLADTITRGSV